MQITLGPFFTRVIHRSGVFRGSPEIIPQGLTLEWSGPCQASTVPIYRFIADAFVKFRLQHILVSASDIPFAVDCVETHVIETPESTFLPLEALIAALYQANEVARPIQEVLGELATLIPMFGSVACPAAGQGLLTKKAESGGFRLIHAMKKGREVLLGIAWKPAEADSFYHVANFRFMIHGGTLSEGTWVSPQGEIGVAKLLAQDFQKQFPDLKQLLTEEGVKYVTSLRSL